MKNQGISLITLIITIIVIIILAAIVLFQGLNAPDSANFARFTQQVDNLSSAVLNSYANLLARHAISGETRTQEQIYLEIALGEDQGQYKTMGTTAATSSGDKVVAGTGIQNITTAAEAKEYLNMKLPKVRESSLAWYVTQDGRVFNANGYVYDGNTYFTGGIYQKGELAAVNQDLDARAGEIWSKIANDLSVTEISGVSADE